MTEGDSDSCLEVSNTNDSNSDWLEILKQKKSGNCKEDKTAHLYGRSRSAAVSFKTS